jgi:hypothetical protein
VTIVIYRTNPRNLERAVRVSVNWDTPFSIDPTEEVARLRGGLPGRKGCIISMAEGMVAANHDVYYVEPGVVGYKVHQPNYYPTLHEFFLIGYAIGVGKQNVLRHIMCSMPAHIRQDVFARTGAYYMHESGRYICAKPTGLIVTL